LCQLPGLQRRIGKSPQTDPAAGLALTSAGVTGGTDIPLTAGGTLTADQKARFPQLSTGYAVLTLPSTLKQADFDALVRGQLAVFVERANGSLNDLSIYELHVRDFSVGDATVPAGHRGTYLAFTDMSSDSMKHLEQLADAGLKAVHLLPTFHFNSINEDKTTWKTTPDLTGFAPDSQSQQAAVAAVRARRQMLAIKMILR
jgi:hypothetical protein